MAPPDWVYRPGTNLGMTIFHNGAFLTKKLKVNFFDEHSKEHREAMIEIKSFNQPVWVWTGYRWLSATCSTLRYEFNRDKIRYDSGRKLKDNEWL